MRAIDLRYLERWAATAAEAGACGRWAWMRSTWGRRQKFLTVVSNLETGEPLWFGRERKKETLDEFFRRRVERAGSGGGSRRPAWTCGSRTG